MIEPRRDELLRRRRREVRRDLDKLDRGELWHPLSDERYRGVLLAMLEEIDDELEGASRNQTFCQDYQSGGKRAADRE